MASINELSWKRKSFISKIRLLIKQKINQSRRIHSVDTEIKSETLSELASTYYSVASSGRSALRAKLKGPSLIITVPIWAITWLPLSLWCWQRALANAVAAIETAGGTHKVKPSQIDIVQSILRSHRKYRLAQAYINDGLRMVDSSIEPHTAALLKIGWIDCEMHLHGVKIAAIQMEAREALALAEKCEADEPYQAIRIYRHSRNIFGKFGENWVEYRDRCHSKAESLAMKLGIEDQKLKLS